MSKILKNIMMENKYFAPIAVSVSTVIPLK